MKRYTEVVDAKPHILVIEDDPDVLQGLVRGLKKADFSLSVSTSGNAAVELLLTESFDLVLLDLMLPERSGLEILSDVRTRISTPILVLSARSDLSSRLQSFEKGAVDFVPKPFFMEELIARIRTRLAMNHDAPRRRLDLADVVLDLDARIALRNGTDLNLTEFEFNVLALLRQRTGRALTRTQIADQALSEDGECEDRTVDSHISRIRKKLGPAAAAHIKTVWGIGYRCESPAA